MQDLKFRFWSNLQKRFVEMPLSYVRKNGEIHFKLENDETPIVQEFTGLLDKNNKEIYEGDILIFDEERIGVAAFTHGRFYHQDNQYDESLNTFCIDGTEIIDLEIIGNIFENPELLNK